MKKTIKISLIIVLGTFFVIPYINNNLKAYSFKIALKYTGINHQYQDVALAKEFGESKTSSISNYAYVTPKQFSIATATNSKNLGNSDQYASNKPSNPISLASQNQSTLASVKDINLLLKI